MNISFRVKLVASFCLVVFLMGIVASVISYYLIDGWTLRQTCVMLEGNVASAREVYTDRIAELETILAFTALRPRTVKDALLSRDKKILLPALQEVRNVSGMDMLTATDASGKVVLRAHHPEFSGDNLREDAIVNRVLATGSPANGTVHISRSKLAAESPGLLGRINPPKISRDEPSSDADTGMMIEAAVPIKGENGRIIGVLVGGKLLNGDRSLGDQVKNIVVMNDPRMGKNTCAVSVYRDTMCIASDTMSDQRSPMVGSTVSGEILADASAHQYQIDTRPMKGGWRSIAGYQAIRTIDGKVIGLISVEFRENTFFDPRKRRAMIIAGIIIFSMFCALAAWFVLSKRLVRPIRDLASRAERMAEVKPDSLPRNRNEDEVGVVGSALNLIQSSMRARDIEIRTIREEMNQTRRLSTLGRLAAGVAHEINNPLCGIVVYSNLLLEDMTPGDPGYANVEKIIRESNRCKHIVKSLLDFARQSHPQPNPSDINRIVHEALDNIRREPAFNRIRFVDMLDVSLPPVIADASQIQEVFENIARNAVEAMDGAGVLTVESSMGTNDDGRQVVEVRFSDTGPGIPPENIGHIFDPFFTTKKSGHGTGLGLAVSHGIIERHDGMIAARNGDAGGAVFTVRLPFEEVHA